MRVEFVVGSHPCSEGFSSRFSGFFSLHKNQHSKFQFDLEAVDEEPSRGSATAKFHYYY